MHNFKKRRVRGSNLISSILVIAVLMSLFSITVLADESQFTLFQEPSYSFTDAQGKPDTDLSAGGSASITALVKSNSIDQEPQSVSMVSAIFEKSTGKLADINFSTKLVTSGDILQFECNFDNIKGGSDAFELRTFFWNSLNEAQPIFTYIKYAPTPITTYPDYKIYVTAPDLRSDIYGDVNIKLFANKMKNVTLSCVHQPDAQHPDQMGYEYEFAKNLQPNANGFTEARFPATVFPKGPISIKISASDETAEHNDLVYVQLLNKVGVDWNIGIPAAPPQAQGMELAFSDDFNGPLSISESGTGTTYSSLFPMNDATLDTIPNLKTTLGYNGYNPFTQTDNFLRIHADSNKNLGGLISSIDKDQSGFSSKYGYFESRILCPPGKGVRPAFWLLNAKRVANKQLFCWSDVDIYEAPAVTPVYLGLNVYETKQDEYDNTTGSVKTTYQNIDTHNLSDFTTFDTAQAFHVYGVKIDPEYTTYYIDNVEVCKYKTNPSTKEPMFFMIDLALFAQKDRDLAQYKNGADLYIDYIRVFNNSSEQG